MSISDRSVRHFKECPHSKHDVRVHYIQGILQFFGYSIIQLFMWINIYEKSCIRTILKTWKQKKEGKSPNPTSVRILLYYLPGLFTRRTRMSLSSQHVWALTLCLTEVTLYHSPSNSHRIPVVDSRTWESHCDNHGRDRQFPAKPAVCLSFCGITVAKQTSLLSVTINANSCKLAGGVHLYQNLLLVDFCVVYVNN